MTEDDIRSLPPFAALPIYDEHDEWANTIVAPNAGKYKRIRECWSLDEVKDCLQDPKLVPLGALRAAPTPGQTVVVAYFGELQAD
jgi:hypothetical protein